VVNAANASENFSILMHAVKPDRWKVMRVLPVLTSALEIDYSRFQDFVERHDAFRSLITVEDNSDMVESYIMVDPHGRFFQNGSGCGGYEYSSPILDVGVTTAFREINFNPEKFAARYIGRLQEGASRNEI
jgi:radical S-adenosyl methionine domain-containing protein 2